MKLLNRILGRGTGQQRAVSVADFLGIEPDGRTGTISHETALSMTAVFSAVRLISETLGSLPLHVYQSTDTGREQLRDHPLARLLAQPNPAMTRMAYIENSVACLEARGNSFSEIVRGPAGEILALWPLSPERVRPERRGNAVSYRVSTKNGIVEVGQDRILHFAFHFGGNGVEGVDPITTLRKDLSGHAAARDHARRFFENGAQPGGILRHPSTLSLDAGERLKKQTADATRGTHAHSLLLLEEGITFEALGISPENSQLLESRKFSVTDIARAFRVPPSMIGDTEKMTYSNAEQEALAFVQHSIRPRCIRIEQTLDAALLSPEERAAGLFFRFNLDGLLRGSTLDRYRAHQIAVVTGWQSRNEVRALEDLNRAEGLDEFIYTPGAATATADNTSGQQDTAEEKP